MCKQGCPAAVGTIIGVWFTLFLACGTAFAEVTFFIQREGSPEDDGVALFVAAGGDVSVQDFEDPALGGDGAQLPGISVGDLALSWDCNCNGPFVPLLGVSSAFSAPNKIYRVALVSCGTLTISPSQETPVAALGLWIFDDGRAADSAYLVQVLELDGSYWQATLVNVIPLNSRGHEIEGFIGAVSSVGIASFTIVPVNPEAGLFQMDTFEIDHLMAAALPPPPPPDPPPPGEPGDEGEAGDGDDDPDASADEDNDGGPSSDDRCVRHPRKHHRHPHAANTPHRGCSQRSPKHPASQVHHSKAKRNDRGRPEPPANPQPRGSNGSAKNGKCK